MLPNKLKGIIFDNISKMPLRYVTPVPFSKAEGLVAEVYGQVVEEFFINGAITTHSVRPTLLAGMWCAGRELALADGEVSRDAKEALGVTFAQVNGCTYCEDLMLSVIHGTEDHQLASLMRFHEQGKIVDDETRRWHEWALNCRNPDADIVRNPPFTSKQAPEMLGAALMFNYLNRYVKVFFKGTPVNPPFSSQALKSAMFRGFGVELRPTVTTRLTPGRATALLPEAELPDDLRWAEPNPQVADAAARWSGAVEAAAAEDIPLKTREVVRAAVSAWRGEDMGISRGWVERYLGQLNPAETAAATVGLLTALAPFQVSDGVIDEFRQHFPGDGPLVTIVSWSALTAARRVTAWLAAAESSLELADKRRVAAA